MSNARYQCLRCEQIFPKKYNLDKHLKRKNPCLDKSVKVINNEQKEPSVDTKIQSSEFQEITCEYCQVTIKYRKNLKRHYDSCTQYKNKSSTNNSLEQIDKSSANNLLEQIDKSSTNNFLEQINKLKTEFQQQINELKQQPKVVEQHNHNHNHNHNQILQVVCVGNNDNYLDMLTEELGFDRALGFIKDCALSHLSGDCKLLEKIYFANRNNEAPIRYLDKNRKKIEFVDEMKQKIIDLKGIQLTRRLVNNLQNSYLKGVNYLINRNLDNNLCPNKFLEEYDIQSWNQHIYDLSEASYQKKIIAQLDIPCKSN